MTLRFLNLMVYNGVSVWDFAKQWQWTDSGKEDFIFLNLVRGSVVKEYLKYGHELLGIWGKMELRNT